MPTRDQRAHTRVPLVLSTELVVGHLRYPAVVTDISAGGIGLRYREASPLAGTIGQLEIPGFGCFDGISVRDGSDFRAFRFLAGEGERNALFAKLIRYIEKGLLDPLHAAEPLVAQLCLRRLGGVEQHCEVESISVDGVQLFTEERPPVGELVRMGNMYGRVAQHTTLGVGVRFLSFVSKAEDVGDTSQSEA